MIFTVVVSLAWACGVQAAGLRGGGGGAGGGGARGRPWSADAIVFRDDQPWDGRSYSFGFKTLFGSSRKERAQLKENALGVKYLDVEGEFSYPEEDGSLRRVQYRANDLGYQQTDILTNHIGEDPGNNDAILTNKAGAAANGSLPQAKGNPGKQADKIYFPTEESDTATATTPNGILTTSLAPPVGVNGTNTTSMDYYYDELGNRVGGIPPAVLGSLLG